MATIIYHPSDATLAKRIQADLAAAGSSGPDTAAVIILSQQTQNDASIQRALVDAVEQHRRVVPVLAEAVPLPRLIEHLEPVDFTQGYDFDRLAARLASAPGELQMKVHTPETVAANRRTGLIVGAMALVMFLAALYGIGALGIQPPAEEYDGVETQIVQTRNAYIENALPRSTDDALNFQPTVEAASTALRPLLIATATAEAGE